ncbi:hypothetical protein Fmac_018558 [Flemingia macrophylla]|uniref:Maturase K n=1 Tax=Flemingia macrophylla TaxID=520843 RepID=A0ABD1M5Q3_9FABA
MYKDGNISTSSFSIAKDISCQNFVFLPLPTFHNRECWNHLSFSMPETMWRSFHHIEALSKVLEREIPIP